MQSYTATIHPKRFQLLLLIILFILIAISLQVKSIKASSFAVNETFTGYNASGLESGVGAPTAGMLDSDTWEITGISDGDVLFETNCSLGDCARGASNGGVSTGGVYAFTTDGSGNVILGMQPTGSDFAPGAVTMRLINNTGGVVSSINVSYDGYQLNNTERSTSVDVAYSIDNVDYTKISALGYTTTLVSTPSAAWESQTLSDNITGLNIADGALFYIQWQIDDVAGSGSRDEIGIDNIAITELDPTSVILQEFQTMPANNLQSLFLWVTAGLGLLTVYNLRTSHRERYNR